MSVVDELEERTGLAPGELLAAIVVLLVAFLLLQLAGQATSPVPSGVVGA